MAAFIEYAEESDVIRASRALSDKDFGSGIVSATVTRSSIVGMKRAIMNN